MLFVFGFLGMKYLATSSFSNLFIVGEYFVIVLLLNMIPVGYLIFIINKYKWTKYSFIVSSVGRLLLTIFTIVISNSI